MTMKQLEYSHWIAAALIVLAMALAGCSSARPYTASEKTWLTHTIIGQSLDVITTDMALSDDRMYEANTVWGDPKDASRILVGKAVVVGCGYLVGQWKPEWRKTIWQTLGISGYGAATWNAYQMIDNDVHPWSN